jgi:hypothetical protein
MVKRPAVIVNDRSALQVWSFLFLGFVPLFLWLGWSTRQMGDFLLAVLYAGLCGLYFVHAARWKRMHFARQRAASEGRHAGVPLARPQPVLNAEALPVPFTIRLYPRSFHLLAYMVLVCVGIFLGYSLVLGGRTFDLKTDWPFALFFALFFTALVSWRYCLAQRIMVYADGLVVKHPLHDWLANSWIGNNWQAGEHLIHWHEARLFAIRGGLPGTPATRYELSNPSTVVTFGRARPRRWWALYHPVLPWEHYEAQMEALLDLIAAKTGLPLYDVRGGPAAEPSLQPFLPRE